MPSSAESRILLVLSTLIRRMDPTFDPKNFGSKFLNAVDLEHMRDGLRKAGLYGADTATGRWQITVNFS